MLLTPRVRGLLARPLVVALVAPAALVAGTGAAHGTLLDDLGDLTGGDVPLGCVPIPSVDDCDEQAPETSIDSVSPALQSGFLTVSRVAFGFSGTDDRDDASLTFECRLVTPTQDDPSWSTCDPAEGVAYDVPDARGDAYRFEVRATDDAITFPNASAPNTDPSPATQSFGVDTTAPETRKFGGPARYEPSRSAEFLHGGTGGAGDYACRLDRVPIACEQDFLALDGLSSGKHRLTVAARDELGNTDATPVRSTWWVPRNEVGTTKQKRRWSRLVRSDAFDGTVLTTRRKGAALTTKVRGARSIGLIVGKGPDAGRLRVKLNRKTLGVVDLDDPTARFETVPFDLPGRKKRRGTVRIIPIDRGAPVAVDGFFTS